MLSGRPGRWLQPLPRDIGRDRRYPRHPSMPWHPDGRPREGGSSGLVHPRGFVWKQQRHARYGDQKQRQLWLGTKWESRALAGALCRSLLLTCARASSAEISKCPGGGNVDAFLGVKGSPVQIRPSRLVTKTFRIYFRYTRANKRANLLCNGPSTGVRRPAATASLRGMCQYRRAD